MKDFFRQNQFDVYEPKKGHKERFLQKLQDRQKPAKIKSLFYKSYRKWMVAAGIILLFGLIFQTGRNFQEKKMDNAQINRNEQYFSMIIKEKLEEINKEKTPETEKVFNDAMQQIKLLENDYQQLVKDYRENKNKHILNAMIENFQQRIDILQFLKQQIKEIKEYKQQQNEKYKA